tara:strand:- start:2241 stop:2393 length:153 start_codon:yes stop_codon:yes gene_type:complete
MNQFLNLVDLSLNTEIPIGFGYYPACFSLHVHKLVSSILAQQQLEVEFRK